MHAPKTNMSHQRIDRNCATFFMLSTVTSNRIITTDTTKPDTTMVAASAAPSQPSVRCTLTLRTRTKADCVMKSTIQAENATP